MDAAIGVAGAVAQPEIGVPILVVTHPKKSIGAVLLAWTIVLLLIGIVLSVPKFSRGIGHVVLIIGVLTGAASAWMLFSKKKEKKAAQ